MKLGPVPVRPTSQQVSALHISGINRGAGEEVPTLFAKIRENMKDYFEFDTTKTDDDLRNDFVINQVGTASSREGYDFQLLLPLKQKVEVPLSGKATAAKK